MLKRVSAFHHLPTAGMPGLRRYAPVFKHRAWLRYNVVYRTRYLSARRGARFAPDFIDRSQLTAALHEANEGILETDPLSLGRVISICLWWRLAKQRYTAGRQAESV